MAPWWPRVRALLCTAAALLMVLDGVPLPDVTQKQLDGHTGRAQLRRWAEVTGRSAAELEELGLRMGKASRTFERTVKAPLEPLHTWTRTGQSWGLFAFPLRSPGGLVVEGFTVGGESVPLFPEGDPWLVRRLAHRRVRGAWDRGGDTETPNTVYERVATWAGRQMLDRHPELARVEVRMERRRVPEPGGTYGPRKVLHLREVAR